MFLSSFSLRGEMVIVVLVLGSMLNGVNCAQKTRTWIRWDMADVTFGTPVTVQGSFTVMECLERCERSDSCVSAHVNKDSSSCEFSLYYPLHGNLVPEPRQGWRVYYRELKEVRGIAAWPNTEALRTIDGLIETSTTQLLYLGLEFLYSGNIETIYTHFLEGDWEYQNRNFTLLVYTSFADAQNDVNGKVCVEYLGDAIVVPTNFTCQQPLYGKALRVNFFWHGYAEALRLREIRVFHI